MNSPKTVREQITDKIRDDLVSGTFVAGTMLRETELAKRFGVSRGPVRDAFIQLSQEGYLAYHANRGVMVRHPPNPKDREFIASLRRQIEIYVVEAGLDRVTESGLEMVEAALNQLKLACESGDATAVALADVKFHEAILVACDGTDMIGAWRQLCSKMMLTYTRLKDYQQGFDEHLAIFEALRSRNVQAVVNAINDNIR